MAYIGKIPATGAFQKCDALSASATADYTLQVGSTNVVPESVNHMIVSLNGVIQQPGATGGFTVSGSTLSFASALTSNDTIDFVMLLGNVLDIGVCSDATVSNAKLASDLISGETDIGGAIADADLMLLDDGAGGTLRKSAMSRVKTYIDAANTPAFFASISESQTVGTASATKLTINAEEFDSDSTYDNSSNYRFTPGVAGKYFIFANGYINSLTNAKTVVIYIYKNGASIATARNVAGKTGAILTAYTSVIDISDADDYYEVYLYHDEGGDLTVPGSGEARSYFGAYKIIGA